MKMIVEMVTMVLIHPTPAYLSWLHTIIIDEDDCGNGDNGHNPSYPCIYTAYHHHDIDEDDGHGDGSSCPSYIYTYVYI